jgi:hypothetical protein
MIELMITIWNNTHQRPGPVIAGLILFSISVAFSSAEFAGVFAVSPVLVFTPG